MITISSKLKGVLTEMSRLKPVPPLDGARRQARSPPKWSYVYIPQGTFEKLSSHRFDDLVSLCKPALAELVTEAHERQASLPFAQAERAEALREDEFISAGDFSRLPSRYQSSVRQAIMLFRFLENKENLSFAAVFTPLLGALEDASNSLLLGKLAPAVPSGRIAEKEFFNPILTGVDGKKQKYLQDEIKKLERTLVFRSPISPVGHLRFCLEYANRGREELGGILKAVKEAFATEADVKLLELSNSVYQFRNKYIAHQEHATVSKDLARAQLGNWIQALAALYDRGIRPS